jgi:hypothetical protein
MPHDCTCNSFDLAATMIAVATSLPTLQLIILQVQNRQGTHPPARRMPALHDSG